MCLNKMYFLFNKLMMVQQKYVLPSQRKKVLTAKVGLYFQSFLSFLLTIKDFQLNLYFFNEIIFFTLKLPKRSSTDYKLMCRFQLMYVFLREASNF